MSQEALLAEIQEERTKELAFEGHRWFDLRRTTRPRIEKVIDGKTYILEKDDAHCVFHRLLLMLIQNYSINNQD